MAHAKQPPRLPLWGHSCRSIHDAATPCHVVNGPLSCILLSTFPGLQSARAVSCTEKWLTPRRGGEEEHMAFAGCQSCLQCLVHTLLAFIVAGLQHNLHGGHVL